jgi:hypothetical protein
MLRQALLFATLGATAFLFVGLTPASARPLSSATVACSSGYVDAHMSTGEKCLRAGEFCTVGDPEYHAYGFDCPSTGHLVGYSGFSSGSGSSTPPSGTDTTATLTTTTTTSTPPTTSTGTTTTTVAPAPSAVTGASISQAGGSSISAPYKNCTQLHHLYPHGLGKVGATDRVADGGAAVTTFKRSNQLYALAMSVNRGLDRDHDGIACEQA